MKKSWIVCFLLVVALICQPLKGQAFNVSGISGFVQHNKGKIKGVEQCFLPLAAVALSATNIWGAAVMLADFRVFADSNKAKTGIGNCYPIPSGFLSGICYLYAQYFYPHKGASGLQTLVTDVGTGCCVKSKVKDSVRAFLPTNVQSDLRTVCEGAHFLSQPKNLEILSGICYQQLNKNASCWYKGQVHTTDNSYDQCGTAVDQIIRNGCLDSLGVIANAMKTGAEVPPGQCKCLKIIQNALNGQKCCDPAAKSALGGAVMTIASILNGFGENAIKQQEVDAFLKVLNNLCQKPNNTQLLLDFIEGFGGCSYQSTHPTVPPTTRQNIHDKINDIVQCDHTNNVDACNLYYRSNGSDAATLADSKVYLMANNYCIATNDYKVGYYSCKQAFFDSSAMGRTWGNVRRECQKIKAINECVLNLLNDHGGDLWKLAKAEINAWGSGNKYSGSTETQFIMAMSRCFDTKYTKSGCGYDLQDVNGKWVDTKHKPYGQCSPWRDFPNNMGMYGDGSAPGTCKW